MARYTCPACSADVDLPDPAPAGLVVTCPKCHAPVETPPPSRPAARRGRRTASGYRTGLRVLVGFVVLCWAAVLVDQFLPAGKSLLRFGIHPLDPDSLVNILFAPVLHGGFVHVFANTLGFATLGWLVLVRSPRHFLLVSVISALSSGLGCWVFGGPGTVHFGASGIVFGYLGFLLAWGYFERSVKSFAITVFVAIVFGGMIWGLLPRDAGVSWQGHLFGLLGGGLTARFLASRPRRR